VLGKATVAGQPASQPPCVVLGWQHCLGELICESVGVCACMCACVRVRLQRIGDAKREAAKRSRDYLVSSDWAARNAGPALRPDAGLRRALYFDLGASTWTSGLGGPSQPYELWLQMRAFHSCAPVHFV
jgi:hypothetical protein